MLTGMEGAAVPLSTSPAKVMAKMMPNCRISFICFSFLPASARSRRPRCRNGARWRHSRLLPGAAPGIPGCGGGCPWSAQAFLRPVREDLSDQAADDVGERVRDDAHERVAAQLNQAGVEGLVGLGAARALHLVLDAPERLDLRGRAGLHGNAEGLQFDGAAHPVDGGVIDLTQKQHKMQRLC